MLHKAGMNYIAIKEADIKKDLKYTDDKLLESHIAKLYSILSPS
ncbi:hypothetical protein [uncultured Helicobacter sp.]|nr:hypothetical protein [uncultured Helicobacter sp.]